jgi:acetyl-CoA C-acetyltransferase
MAVDPRTPVIVGVGQFTERIDDPGYRGMSAVELATAAAEAALADTGADVQSVAKAIDAVVGLRQFERSVADITTVTEDNRMICDPYPRLLVPRDQVNQGAASLLMSVDAARRLGIPEDKWCTSTATPT